MVKPLVWGIIGGMIGATAIIGGLFAFSAYQDIKYQEFYADYLTAYDYQSEINDFLIETCLDTSFPSSLGQAARRLAEMELAVLKIKENGERIGSLEQEIKNIQQKYSGTQYYNEFNFQEYECPLGALVTGVYEGDGFLVFTRRSDQLDDFVELYDWKKGGDYYVDRYYNEPEYKKWFDERFSELTIEGAVNVACSTCNYDLRGRD